MGQRTTETVYSQPSGAAPEKFLRRFSNKPFGKKYRKYGGAAAFGERG